MSAQTIWTIQEISLQFPTVTRMDSFRLLCAQVLEAGKGGQSGRNGTHQPVVVKVPATVDEHDVYEHLSWRIAIPIVPQP